jgi:hypothetical protein
VRLADYGSKLIDAVALTKADRRPVPMRSGGRPIGFREYCMQERRYRPGDVLDDYCPRERRITDHAIVAMIDDEIRRTRCGICDAEHEYKEGKVPAPRRKTQPPALFTQVLENINGGTPKPQPPLAAEALAEEPVTAAAAVAVAERPEPPAEPEPAVAAAGEPAEEDDSREEGGFRRSLIRATFPRPEGQAPPQQRNAPEFTLQSLNNRRNNQRHSRGRRRPGGAGGFDNIGPMRFRDHGSGQGQGQGQNHGGGRRRRGGKKNR